MDGRTRLGLVALVLGLALAQVVTVPAETDWDGDWAGYLGHARNLAMGEPYAATGYVYEPDYASLAPAAYPPAYPLVLVPAVLAWDDDLRALRRYGVALVALTLAGFAWTLRRRVSTPLVFAGVTALGLDQGMWEGLHHFGPDVLFVGVVATVCGLAGRPAGDRAVREGVLLGALLALGYALRTVGVVLAASVLVTDLLTTRRIDRRTAVALAVFCAWAAVQAVLVPGVGSYGDQVAPSLSRALENAHAYLLPLRILLWPTGSALAEILLAVVTAAALLIGLLASPRRSLVFSVTFVALYVAVLLAWDVVEGQRLLLPLLPPTFLMALAGIDRVLDRASGRAAAVVALLTTVTFGAPHVSWLHAKSAERRIGGVESPDAEATFAWVRANVPEGDVVAFGKPRILAVRTARRSVAPSPTLDPEDLAFFLDARGARWLVLGPTDAWWYRADFAALASERPARFTEAFAVQRFTVYRVAGSREAP